MNTRLILSTIKILILIVNSYCSFADEVSFDPLPGEEFAYFFDVQSHNEEENQYFYQGIKLHSLFNEGSTMFFTARHRVSGQITLEELVRFKFSCKSHELKIIDRKFSNYLAGISVVDTDGTIPPVADMVFSKGKQNLTSALISACKLWNPEEQVENNLNFHRFLSVLHNLVLNATSKKDDFVNSLLFTLGPDYFFEYLGNDQKASKKQSYHQVLIAHCGADAECWEREETTLANMWLFYCPLEWKLSKEWQSDYCLQTDFKID